jgi:ribosomal protein L37E
MKCPECEKSGAKSVLHMDGGGIVTDVCNHSFYDEEGHRHYHDHNPMTECGECSNGHKVVVLHDNKCPFCDFGETTKIRELYT